MRYLHRDSILSNYQQATRALTGQHTRGVLIVVRYSATFEGRFDRQPRLRWLSLIFSTNHSLQKAGPTHLFASVFFSYPVQRP